MSGPIKPSGLKPQQGKTKGVETKPEVKKLNEMDMVRITLDGEDLQRKFKEALPGHVKVKSFIQTLLSYLADHPTLLKCDRASIYKSAMSAARDGLLIDGRESALIPYGNKVQYIQMIEGVLKLIRNSGELGSLAVYVVRQADHFEFWIDQDGEKLNHRPAYTGDRGHPSLCYAIATTKDGAKYFEVMTVAEIEQVRSKGNINNPAWAEWWDEMAKKTVIRRLSKRLPMSSEVADVIRRDDEMYDLSPPVPPQLEKPSGGRLKSIISAQAERIELAGGATGEDLEIESEEAVNPNGKDMS